MAMKIESVGQNDIGIKVEGDLGDLQIIEESSEDEVDVVEGSNNPSGLDGIPGALVRTSDAPKLSNIIVKDSENVQFGNNTYFNGPVTIKQVIQTGNGIDNASYVKEEYEKDTTPPYSVPQDSGNNGRKTTLRLWHKVSLTAVGVMVLAGICVIIVVQQDTSSNTSPSETPAEAELPTYRKLVVELNYGNWPMVLVLMSIITVPITLLLMHFYTLLTNDMVTEGYTRQIEYNKKAGNQVVKRDHLRIVERNEWLAQTIVAPLDHLVLPAPWVIITHTASEACHSQGDCVYRVRIIQAFHIESKHWNDIGYNFLIGGDGSAYEGRGWDSVGAHTKGYNKYSIGIALIGTFSVESPTKYQIDACKKLIALGVEKGKIAKDYKLFPHSAFMSTLSPGKTVIDIIRDWPHYVNESEYNDVSKLLPNY